MLLWCHHSPPVLSGQGGAGEGATGREAAHGEGSQGVPRELPPPLPLCPTPTPGADPPTPLQSPSSPLFSTSSHQGREWGGGCVCNKSGNPRPVPPAPTSSKLGSRGAGRAPTPGSEQCLPPCCQLGLLLRQPMLVALGLGPQELHHRHGHPHRLQPVHLPDGRGGSQWGTAPHPPGRGERLLCSSMQLLLPLYPILRPR